jgi:undecaprenyl-phosphate 4-deoxy-4-formamido-L-arabinose transferase
MGDEQVSGGVPSVSVVIPVYNSEPSLVELTDRLVGALRGRLPAFEILLVDDGSRDGSWKLIERLAASVPEVSGLSLMRNYGQHNALLAGLRLASNDVIVTMDDDLQHRPEEIPALLAALEDDLDLVYGRAREEEHGIWRNASSRIVKRLMAASIGNAMAEQASAFRAFRRELCDSFAANTDPYVSIDVLLSWATTRFASVDVEMDARKYGESNYTFRRLARHAINMLTGYSTVPLRVVAYTGFLSALFGLAVLMYVLGRYFLLDEKSLPGFPFIASLVSILSGAQLFGLGVLGEYLGRMHFRSMQRPAYAIRKRV